MAALSGLLKVKPQNIPSEGDTLTLTHQELKSQKGNTYLKFKRDNEDYGGKPYIVKSVRQGDPDQHGNIGCWIKVEGDSEAPQSPPNAQNGRSGADPRGDSIDRAVAFKGAIEVVVARGIRPGGCRGWRAAWRRPGIKDLNATDVAKRVATVTEALLPVVKGADTPTPQTPEPEREPDDDIPF